MFPGSNLLNQAFRAIRPITIRMSKYHDRVLSSAGVWVTEHLPPVDVKGSVQAVNRSRYEHMGLDFAKTYYMVYLSQDAHDIQRDGSPDRFFLPDGLTYEVVGEDDWFGPDGSWTMNVPGWTGILVVRLARNTVTNFFEPEPEPEPLP